MNKQRHGRICWHDSAGVKVMLELCSALCPRILTPLGTPCRSLQRSTGGHKCTSAPVYNSRPTLAAHIRWRGMVPGRRAIALLTLTCLGVANSTEPVHDGPVQVFIMAGQPACLRGLSCVSHHTLAAWDTGSPHALGCPFILKRCAALQPSRPARAHAHWEAAVRSWSPAEVSPMSCLFTSQASPTWRGLVPQHGTKVTPW